MSWIVIASDQRSMLGYARSGLLTVRVVAVGALAAIVLMLAGPGLS